MSVHIYSSKDFKEMSWKNGGGVTTELFRIPKSDDAFLFRLSSAQVSTSGPFSNFPHVDRILLLTEGNGFHLQGSDLDHTMNDFNTPLCFEGETPIDCTLLNGPCRDFNVMTDRSYAKSLISVVELALNESINFTAECNLRFIYDKEDQNLYKLDLGDQCTIQGTTKKSLIVVDVTLI